MAGQTQKKINYLPERKKMEALGRLSCKAAHDFNNILGAIEGYATLAMNGVKENAPLAQDLREIRASVAKAAALAKQLLVFGGKQMLHKTPCGVNDIIANTLKRAELSPGGGFKIETRLAPGLPAVMTDAAQLEQALANLLLNAREAMPGGGTAAISSFALRPESAAVNPPTPHAAGPLFIRIAVQDSGSGITPEVFEHLFEPLFSTRKKGLGTGLGLSMVYGVVKQHNGWVEVKSEPGLGSEFMIFLPAATD
ncbi:MAG: hypothetical protein HY796_10455 [Elusimicrobia bacterium]|nr:hypothetical protein [Elusimicrobiota bacterium]